jgi:carbonic anhydrase/acetyltransferase-like protein (isoleucine patch superfamily)
MRERPSGGFLETRLDLHPTAFVAPTAVLVGAVSLGPEASVWYGCVLRGDIEPITVGARSNVQDGTVVHIDGGYPTRIGDEVTIGHRAVVHGAVLEDRCLVGMGAIVLSGAVIGEGALVGAGTVVREGVKVPPRTLFAGVPGRVIRELDDELLARVNEGVDHYVAYAEAYRQGRLGGGPHGGR